MEPAAHPAGQDGGPMVVPQMQSPSGQVPTLVSIAVQEGSNQFNQGVGNAAGGQKQWDDDGEDSPSPTGGQQGSDSAELANDAEGVWAADIEQAFQEALAIYPPCGRRKIILSDEGKMYGRNELIARYIKLRTGKVRTRKQVSSHIQVLARKKAREIQAKIKDQATKDKAMQGLSNMSSAQIVSASAIHNRTNATMFAGTPGIVSSPAPAHTMFSGGQAVAAGGSPVLIKQELAQFTANPQMIWQPGQQAAFMLPVSGHTQGSFIALSQAPQQAVMSSPVITAVSANEHDGMNNKQVKLPNLPLRMNMFSAFVEHADINSNDPSTGSNNTGAMKHEFISIGLDANFCDPTVLIQMETIGINHIQDKFPEKNGGLKDLFDKGPQCRFFLVKFWADITTPLLDDNSAFYGVTTQYESQENMAITCSTKVCSFGKQVVEKVETEYPRDEGGGRYVYRITRSPMCEYMISFIHRLKHLPEKYMMNSVLENFTILQVVVNRDTKETLLCLAYVFEVCVDESGVRHRIFRLVKDA